VHNVSFKLNEDDLHRHFEAFGKIVKVQIPKNEYNKSKGIAFIEFED